MLLAFVKNVLAISLNIPFNSNYGQKKRTHIEMAISTDFRP